MIICYHGTDRATAEQISLTGFRKGTYFARHLEDALGFGGGYVFYVRFEEDRFNNSNMEPNWWQFHLAEHVPPWKIWKLVRYQPELLFETPAVVRDP